MKLRRKLFDYDSVKSLRTEGQFQRAYERNMADHSAVTQAMIAAGRGHWRREETRAAAKAGDPLAIASEELTAESRALGHYASEHFGQEPYMVRAKIRAARKSNPKARDPEHRKLVKALDTHFAMDEKAMRKNPRKCAHWNTGDRFQVALDEIRTVTGKVYKKGDKGFWRLASDADQSGFASFDKTPTMYPEAVPYGWVEPAREKNPRKRKSAATGKYAGMPGYSRAADLEAERDTFAVWISGGKTAKVKAESAFEAAEKAYGAPVRHSYGAAMGGNPAVYYAADGSGAEVKVWRSHSPAGRAILKKNPVSPAFVIASSLRNGAPLVFDGDNRFSDSRKPALYRTRIAAQDKLNVLRKHFKTDVLDRAFVRAAEGEEAGAVYGARPRRNPKGRKKFGIGVKGNTLTIFKYAGIPTAKTHPQFAAIIGMFSTRAEMEGALNAQRRGSNVAYRVVDETRPKK
jgi:hypothetical protein